MVIWDCSKEDLEPVFLADVDKLLADSLFEWHVVYGFRSLAMQNVLYKKHLAGGPLAAPPGKSAHNFGLAIDVQLWITDPKTGKKRMEWNVKHPGWVWLFKAIKPTPHLSSGIAFGDYDHIQRYRWQQFKNWADLTQQRNA